VGPLFRDWGAPAIGAIQLKLDALILLRANRRFVQALDFP
jgi:hypothetical protein